MPGPLDKNGNILEITSRRYGKKPIDNSKRERFLRRWRWAWLLIPIAGIVGYVIFSEELTDDYGYSDWWR